MAETSKISSCMKAAITKLSRQAVPSKKLIDFLQKKGFSSEEINETVATCTQQKWLDDAAWLTMKVRSLVAKKKSRRQMIPYLQRYGFSLEELLPYLPLDTKEALHTLIEKRYSILLEKNHDRKAFQKAFCALLRRGFTYTEIQEVIQL